MTNEEAINYNKNLREYMRITDKLREYMSITNEKSEYKFLQENYEALDMGNKALEQTMWIPCSERLPDYDTQVIITVLDDSGDNPYRYTTVGWRFYDAWISDNELVFGKVLAWKPIPEKPYEGE